ncbi:hypothetical protein ACFFX0_14490 [Citricoccus parietis]|uniref:Uncharacterized protein n=1 Tax=Citricoccus parietis TaxID=592307 RepID=A0ABV5G083_9MICC
MSSEALSTTITSAGATVCCARARRHRSSRTASSRAGITTLTNSRFGAGAGTGTEPCVSELRATARPSRAGPATARPAARRAPRRPGHPSCLRSRPGWRDRAGCGRTTRPPPRARPAGRPIRR